MSIEIIYIILRPARRDDGLSANSALTQARDVVLYKIIR